MSKPILLSLLVADRILIETNGKKTLVSVFSKFFAQKLPVQFPSWSIYIAITNLAGNYDFTVNLIHAETKENILPINGTISSENIDDFLEIPIHISSNIFVLEGKYFLEFSINGEILGVRNLYLELLAEPMENQNE